MPDLALPREVTDAIGYYVYALRDPRDGQIFYVGKGTGSRLFSHVRNVNNKAVDPDLDPPKVERIRSIINAGLEVEHLFVRVGMHDEATALIVEQAVIDALRAHGTPLTNLARGHHSSSHGLSTVHDVVAAHSAQPAPHLPVGSVIFIINRKWQPGDSDAAVFQSTQGSWKIGARSRSAARVALGVAHGVIRGMYTVDLWQPSTDRPGRWSFVGDAHPDRSQFVGTHVRDLLAESGSGSQNPVRLFL